MSTNRLILSNMAPIGSGANRDVYVHPTDPGLLVKIHRKRAPYPWYRFRKQRYGIFLENLREIREQIALWHTYQECPPCIQKIVGLVETDLGPGLAVEASLDEQGNISPTIRQMIEQGQFGKEAARDLEIFFDRLCETPVVAPDLTPKNIVYAFKPNLGKHFVLIDGYGFGQIIPFELNRYINVRNKRRRQARLFGRIERESKEVAIGESAP